MTTRGVVVVEDAVVVAVGAAVVVATVAEVDTCGVITAAAMPQDRH